jgi:hypothetical protein
MRHQLKLYLGLKAICSLQQQGEICCNYGSKGTATKGYDCVVIPGVAKTGGTKITNVAICGNVGLITKSGTSKSGGKGKTLCSEYHKTCQIF